nr:hypothetical protein [Tanacetum cinerariifolium]
RTASNSFRTPLGALKMDMEYRGEAPRTDFMEYRGEPPMSSVPFIRDF